MTIFIITDDKDTVCEEVNNLISDVLQVIKKNRYASIINNPRNSFAEFVC